MNTNDQPLHIEFQHYFNKAYLVPWVWLYLWKFKLGVVWIHAFYLLSSRCPQDLHKNLKWEREVNSLLRKIVHRKYWQSSSTRHMVKYCIKILHNNLSFSVNMYSYIINKVLTEIVSGYIQRGLQPPTPLQLSFRGSIKQLFKVYDSTRTWINVFINKNP